MEPVKYNSNVQTNSEIRTLARNQLTGNWGVPVVTALAYIILTVIIDAIPVPGTEFEYSSFWGSIYESGTFDGFGGFFEEFSEELSEELNGQSTIKIPLLTTLLSGALGIGLCVFHITFARKGEAELPLIFDGFKQFIQSIIAGILMSIIVTLGLIFFIIPGIILSLGLSQTYYIMADKPGTKAIDAMKQSWEMTKGYKVQLFSMSVSFIPWAFLCIFTCGIGFLWLMPYMYVSFSHFYLQLVGDNMELGIEDHLIVGE